MGYFIDSDERDSLSHYGTLTYSGRYRWGSGEDPYQRLNKFLSGVQAMKTEGYKESDIAKAFGLSTSADLRSMITVSKYDKSYLDHVRVVSLREKGYGYTEIAKRMGWPASKESQVRKILAPNYLARQQKFESAMEAMRTQINAKEMVDVGKGVQEALRLKETEKNTLVRALELEGYNKHILRERSSTGYAPTTMVLTKPDITRTDVYKNKHKIQVFSGDADTIDKGKNPSGTLKPISVNKDRVMVRYGGEGGEAEDGLIYIRPGVKDLNLGGKHYAQVRILVNDTHYAKGVAVYKPGLPKGVDMVVNTPKTRDVPIFGDASGSILKPIKSDPNDPNNVFGSAISRQITDVDSKGKVKVTSAINLINEEGDWETWSRNMPSQFLSKQDDKLIRSQLDVTQNRRREELNEIKSLTNPVVKRHMLEKYADSIDSATVDLKAAAVPRQRTHVILPVPTLKDNEIYAPNYRNGERVSLVRFPHAGPFEIPELIVNNEHPDAKKMIKQASVAVGINARVAEKLSGADFDGDTVMVIPNDSGRIKARPPLQGLKNFDPHVEYQERPGMTYMTKSGTGMEMGKISNLITDMYAKGATDAELANAVKHSMVVIDAEKHRLDYKASEEQNRIQALRKKYQAKDDGRYGGASTLLSRASAPTRVPEVKIGTADQGGKYTPEGDLNLIRTNRTYPDRKTGEIVEAKTLMKGMEAVKDARDLSSGTHVESLYADHANTLKALGRDARKTYQGTKLYKRDPEATKKYATEIAELDEALRKAYANKPYERLAQRAADARVAAVLEDNPTMSTKDLSKYRARAVKTARDRVGAEKSVIYLTDKQWEAVQAHAVSPYKLSEILANGDQERIVSLATPKQSKSLSTSKISQIKALGSQGYTQAEIAERLGISTSTVNEYI